MPPHETEVGDGLVDPAVRWSFQRTVARVAGGNPETRQSELAYAANEVTVDGDTERGLA